MEGTLSKWTNVVHRWQYRYFLLDDDVLRYYTSKEKMIKGHQRGCIRLTGAAIGINGGNDPLFTITVDDKGRDQEQRDAWVRALERVIHNKSRYYRQGDPVAELNSKITHAEQQSQTLLDHVRQLEQIEHDSGKLDLKQKQLLNDVLQITKRLQNTVDLSLVILDQVNRHFGLNTNEINGETNKKNTSKEGTDEENSSIDVGEDMLGNINQVNSYSSDEDEFFDADSDTKRFGAGAEHNCFAEKSGLSDTQEEPDWGDSAEDFDRIYDNPEEQDLGNVQQQHGSVLMHLLSQVSVGMDLTKVTLPTFILERRSLLEMYADFFSHPDDFISGVDLLSPEERFISVVRYYLNSIYPARKSGVAKKPYNPILGETFRCRWTVPGSKLSNQKTNDGPFPGSDLNQVTFIAEQVSHHPPVSAFYAEHPGKKVSFSAHIWTKSSFLGLSIGVTNVGQGIVTLHEFGEEYKLTFPNGYGRSIMSTPWIELGGKVEVKCEKTGYKADIEFLSKPFFGGRAHKINGSIYKINDKSNPIMTLHGEWNKLIYAKRQTEKEFLFSDVREKPDVKKECEPVMQQSKFESRRLWRHVTAALFNNNINVASSSKRFIEQRQRVEARLRKELNESWKCKYFEENGDGGWRYRYAFEVRNPSNLSK